MSEQKINIRDLRQDYKASSLSEKDVDKNPIQQFSTWFNQAFTAQITEPNAMMLATASADGIPNARIMLLKGFNEEGFTFFTNYNSQKASEISKNPNVSLLFFWLELERQIKIKGKAFKISEKESEDYFHSRPHGSQLGAHVSPQSSVIPDRAFLENRLKALQEEYKDKEIPKPAHWGGYIVKPEVIEFWQGGSGRLHDRIVYTLQDNNTWKIERLAP